MASRWFRHALRLKQDDPQHSTAVAVSLALFITLVGLAMVVHLVSAGGEAYVQSEYNNGSTMTSTNNGIIDTPSSHSVDQTVEKLRNILRDKGIRLFALIDNSGEAQKVGMKMPAATLLIFGNPKSGTPVILASPRAAIDLPLNILVWEDGQGKVWLSYGSSEYLKQHHSLPDEVVRNIAVVGNLASAAAK